MDRIEAMTVFLSVIEAGSLLGAARNLRCSPASVTRAVAQIEEMAGERLLERSTRHFNVTEAGLRYATTYRNILAQLQQLHETQSEPTSGSIVITAPELFGRLHIMPIVETFLEAFPRTQVRTLFLNRVVDLVNEGVDVAVRLATLPDSSHKAVKLGEVHLLTCASPQYLEKFGLPLKPTDLSEHQCIALNDASFQELMRYRTEGPTRRNRSVKINCRLATNSASAAIDAAERGAGIVHVLSYQVKNQILEGKLVPILDDFRPDPVPVNLLFRPVPGNGGALRAFIDHTVPRLQKLFKKPESMV